LERQTEARVENVYFFKRVEFRATKKILLKIFDLKREKELFFLEVYEYDDVQRKNKYFN
jgi:hypothetical protein